MTTANTTGKYRNIKLRVNNLEESEAVQKMLFDDGCIWSGGSTRIEFLPNRVFFISPDGTMTHSGSMTPARDSNRNCVEVEVDFERVLVAKIKERSKTVLFGKTYYTDELNARLEGLTAC